MTMHFSKYQGTGNDFVMIDNREGDYDDLTIAQIRLLCDRKLGVGADGLIKICSHQEYDFEVDYYNSDGSQSFCGNGARCSVAFAKKLGIIEDSTEFWAIDGAHKASVDGGGIVRLEMLPVSNIDSRESAKVLDTGSPHYVKFISDDLDIVEFGKQIRYSDEFKEDGINVNTIQELESGKIRVETYERGVEDETLSCGTGVTACALVYMNARDWSDSVSVLTKGGELSVEARESEEGFDNIWLSGPAINVFDGSVEL